MSQVQFYSGFVNTIIYEDASKSFYILRMVLDEKKDSPIKSGGLLDLRFDTESLVVAKGNLPGMQIKVGSWFGFEGSWVNHPEHGKQLQIYKAPVLKDDRWDSHAALNMLQSHGISSVVCNTLRKHFGEDVLEALRDLSKLESVPGINSVTAELLHNKWKNIQSMFKTLVFLRELGLSKTKVQAVWHFFGDDTETVLSENPWRLVELDGFTFEQADQIASKLHLDMTCQDRMRGATLYCAKAQKGMGHLYVTSGDLFAGVCKYIPNITQRQMAEAIVDAVHAELLVVDRKTKPGVTAIYEPWFHHVEDECSLLLKERMISASRAGNSEYLQSFRSVGVETAIAVDMGATLTKVAEEAVEEWGSLSKLQLSPDQKLGVIHALADPVSILTGLPGTGKSTSLKAAVQILKDMQESVLLLAPTGIAAKRLQAVTGVPAYTVHRAFGAGNAKDVESDREETYKGVVATGGAEIRDGSEEYWEFGPENPHPATVVIVDEYSMVDQSLMYRILTCTSKRCRLVFVGDAAQLPSVGPGNVLRDLIASDLFPMVRLEEIFRQSDTSGIVYASHEIYHGQFPNLDAYQKDFVLLPMATDDEVLNGIIGLVRRMYDRELSFQVLSPRHLGTIGVTNLNHHLRELINPSQQGVAELKIGSEILREGDRVMVVKNNYKLGVFNGDLGKIHKVARQSRKVLVKVYGSTNDLIEFTFEDVKTHLRLAYACTVHKFQGLEIDNIIMPVVPSLGPQLQRNLLYTAVTRAKKKVVLLGSTASLQVAIRNDKQSHRNTLFLERLTDGF